MPCPLSKSARTFELRREPGLLDNCAESSTTSRLCLASGLVLSLDDGHNDSVPEGRSANSLAGSLRCTAGARRREQALTCPPLPNSYFTHLHPYIYHLSPLIHTPRFLRDTSPFLTTALAYAVAGFDPQSQHLIQPLQGHVMFLSDRVFSEGHKTVEIVQGYCLLV